MGVAASVCCRRWVATAAPAVGWSQYVNKLLDNFLGQTAAGAPAAPRDATRVDQPARGTSGGRGHAVRGAADPGRQRIGHRQHRHGDHRCHYSACSRWSPSPPSTPTGSPTSPFGAAGVGAGCRNHLLLLYRHGRGLHRQRRGQEPAEDHARALVAALLVVTLFYVLVSVAAPSARRTGKEFDEQEAGLAVILDKVTGANSLGHGAGRRRGDLDLSR